MNRETITKKTLDVFTVTVPITIMAILLFLFLTVAFGWHTGKKTDIPNDVKVCMDAGGIPIRSNWNSEFLTDCKFLNE